jgi:predicted ATPase
VSTPAAISVAFFRSFRRWTTLELRPLTLLYGPNNVGKSALLRILPLLGDSIASGATVPLVLSGAAGRGASFQDVLWGGERDSDELKILGLRIDWPASANIRRLELGIEAVDSVTPILRSLSVWGQESAPLWRADRVVRELEDPSAELTFDVRIPGRKAQQARFRFEGIVPVSCNRKLPGVVEVRDALQSLRQGGIQWLTAPRHFKDRLIPEPVGIGARSLPAEGGVGVLQTLRKDDDLTRLVSEWYRKGGGAAATGGSARELRFEPVPPSHFRAYLTIPGGAGPTVHVADAGAGWVQLLAVLTALAMAGRRDGPRILAIEEPEANLHPSAQRAIAEAVVHVLKAEPDVRVVLETHSYPLLQYVQLEILKQRLKTSDVLAYWVYQTENGESRLTKGTFTDEGRLEGGWPTAAFDESLQLAREIATTSRGIRTTRSTCPHTGKPGRRMSRLLC